MTEVIRQLANMLNNVGNNSKPKGITYDDYCD